MLNINFYCIGCHIARIGDSSKNSKTVKVEGLKFFTCPQKVDQNVWLSGETYTDTENLMTFYVRKFDNEIKVMRTDANAGWNIDLTFKCCSKGLYKMIQALSLRFW